MDNRAQNPQHWTKGQLFEKEVQELKRLMGLPSKIVEADTSAAPSPEELEEQEWDRLFATPESDAFLDMLEKEANDHVTNASKLIKDANTEDK